MERSSPISRFRTTPSFRLAAFLIVVFAGSWRATNAAARDGDDPGLRQLWAKSDYVLHVKVVEVQGGEQEELGVEMWAAKCQILTAIKQKAPLKKNVNVRFQHFQKRTFGKANLPNTEPPTTPKDLLKLVRGREYVVFLSGTAGGVLLPSDEELQTAHKLTDRWLGVQDADDRLQERLKQYGTEKPFVVE